jgi:PAS domain S-box-containing protein
MSLLRFSVPWASFGHLRGSVAFRLVASILLFSSVVTLTLTALQLYLDYRHDVGIIESRLDEIEKSYLSSLGESLWHLDAKQLELQLNGILRLPDIRTVEVHETAADQSPLVVTAGQRETSSVIVREIPIVYLFGGTKQLIGSLHVEATLTGVYRELMQTALVILISQAAKTFLVSLFIIYIFYRLVTRHLTAIAEFVGSYDLRHPPPPFSLQRHPPEDADELEKVVAAFNALCATLQIAHGRIRRLVDSNIIGVIFWNIGGKVTAANEAFLGIVGYTQEDLASGKIHWMEMTPPEFHAQDEQLTDGLRSIGHCPPFEKEYVRKDGSRVPVLLGAALFEGSTDEGVAFVLDLTERKQAEKQQKLLLNELNHRVKNTLAIVLAITGQTFRTAESPEAFREALEARLLALSETHNLLTESAWQGASLHDVARMELMPHANGEQGRVALAGKEVRLGPKGAVTLGMVFHELATNAAKYGALSVPSGRVQITWDLDVIDSERRLRIKWLETGGPPVQAPRRKGFGLRLIERGLGREFAGGVSIEFSPDGVCCVMDMPLDRLSES